MVSSWVPMSQPVSNNIQSELGFLTYFGDQHHESSLGLTYAHLTLLSDCKNIWVGQEWIMQATINPMLWFIYYFFHMSSCTTTLTVKMVGDCLLHGLLESSGCALLDISLKGIATLKHEPPCPSPPAPANQHDATVLFNQFLFTVLKFVMMSTAHVIGALFGRSTKNCIILSGWTTIHPLGLYFGKLNILWVPYFLIHPPSTKSL